MLHETTLAAWLANGPRLVRECPDITTVSLTDRLPMRRGRHDWLWRRSDKDAPCNLPWWLFAHMPIGRHPFEEGATLPAGCYGSDMIASAALSQACLAWAKAQPYEPLPDERESLRQKRRAAMAGWE